MSYIGGAERQSDTRSQKKRTAGDVRNSAALSLFYGRSAQRRGKVQNESAYKDRKRQGRFA